MKRHCENKPKPAGTPASGQAAQGSQTQAPSGSQAGGLARRRTSPSPLATGNPFALMRQFADDYHSERGSGRLLGAAAVGPRAAELIHELVAVLYYRGTVQDLAAMPHYHPTLSEVWTFPAQKLATGDG